MEFFNRDKIKHLPFNFIWCISSFLVPFYLISIWFDINIWLAVGISIYIYLMDIKTSTEIDTLEERIKKLEDSKKENETI